MIYGAIAPCGCMLRILAIDDDRTEDLVDLGTFCRDALRAGYRVEKGADPKRVGRQCARCKPAPRLRQVPR